MALPQPLCAARTPVLVLVGVISTSCFRVRASEPGAETQPQTPRPVRATDVALSPDYVIEPVGFGLTYPTGVALDDRGGVYVVESGYAYGEDFTKPRLLEVKPDGNREIASGDKNGPWNGVVLAEGAFYIAEGGETDGGRILKVTHDGKITALAENLPSRGDHHTNGPAIGPDGAIYFGQGTSTNSGVVGEDNAAYGWLRRHVDQHDIPCADVTLEGWNFESKDPLHGGAGSVTTGAFVPFGTKTEKGQVVKGAVPCNGAVLRIPKEGGKMELVAWGFRNPYGLAFSPDGKLFVTDNGFDDRGSRPVWGAADELFFVEQGGWYGWPDYSGGLAVAQKRFKAPGKDQPRKLLARDPSAPIAPVARFGVHSSANGFDFSRNEAFGYVGQAFVAEFGDLSPPTGKVLSPVGFRVVRVDTKTGVIADFISNKGDKNGPASFLKSGGIERPVAVRFDRTGRAMYVVDFGEMTATEQGLRPVKGTGIVWKVTRKAAGGS
jgi:glucose/arabinose dehydrogenase